MPQMNGGNTFNIFSGNGNVNKSPSKDMKLKHNGPLSPIKSIHLDFDDEPKDT